MSTITSANSVFNIVVPKIYPVPQTLQGYAADDAFSIDSVDITENMIGVDGKKASGYTPYLVVMNIAFQANSQSILIFDTWLGVMTANKEDYPAYGTIFLPSVGRNYVCTNGSLSKAKPIPDAKKVLQPQQYTITWESVIPSPV